MRKTVSTVIALVVLLLCLSGCTQPLKRFNASFLNVFDTVTTITGYAKSEEEFKQNAQKIYDELYQYHKLFDKYESYDGIANIKTINDSAGLHPVEVEPELLDLIELSIELYHKTDGYMNIALGSVLNIWHDYRDFGIENPEKASLPPMDELKAAASHTDISQIEIDRVNSTVFLRDPDMQLDVGAIAKGYAAQKVAEFALANGCTSYILNVGGNVCTLNPKPDDTPWNVGIQNPDPDAEEDPIMQLKLSNAALVSSGSYQRYYTVEGKRYHHIINPDTLMPAEFFSSVSVVSEDSAVADALSTALFNMNLEDGQACLAKFKDAEAVWIDLNGNITKSSGIAALHPTK